MITTDTNLHREPIRARRRREKLRMIAKALKYIKRDTFASLTPTEMLDKAKKQADTFKKCSCYMCGNQRKNFLSSTDERMTINEKREWINMEEQYKEMQLVIPRKRAGKVNGR